MRIFQKWDISMNQIGFSITIRQMDGMSVKTK